MKVTTKVFPMNNYGNFKASASITIEDKICITGIKLLEGKKGKFISFPQYQKGGEYHDLVFPLNGELREKLTRLIVTEYEKTVKNAVTENDTI